MNIVIINNDILIKQPTTWTAKKYLKNEMGRKVINKINEADQ